MRSQDEHDDPIDSSNLRQLQLLSEVDRDPETTQRLLSHRLGIALGLTNLLLRNLTQKGYVRVAKASWKRRLYTLTPEGFLHRIRLMRVYIDRVLTHYKTIRLTLREELEPLYLNEESRVAIYGTEEFAELVYLGLKDIGIEEIDIFGPDNAVGRRFLGMPVQNLATLQPDKYDRIVVAQLGGSDNTSQEFIERGVGPGKLVTFFANGKSREVG